MFSLFWEAGEEISALGSKTKAFQWLLHYQPWERHSWSSLNRSWHPSLVVSKLMTELFFPWYLSGSDNDVLRLTPLLELLLSDKGIIYTDVNALVEIFIFRCECTCMCVLSCVYTCTCVYVHGEDRGQYWVSSSIPSLPYCMVWGGVLESASHQFSRLSGQ